MGVSTQNVRVTARYVDVLRWRFDGVGDERQELVRLETPVLDALGDVAPRLAVARVRLDTVLQHVVLLLLGNATRTPVRADTRLGDLRNTCCFPMSRSFSHKQKQVKRNRLVALSEAGASKYPSQGGGG